MKVLVTGAGGFVGSHLVESQLAQGHVVRAVDLILDNVTHLAGNPNLELVRGDLTDFGLIPSLMDDVDVVYHLASAHLDVTLPDEHYRRVNVEATQALLKEANAAGIQRFLHCSTNSVVGELKHLPVDETAECRPTNVYEATKLEGEKVALGYARETGFPVVVVRPAWVYGPRCPRTARLMRSVRKGNFIMFGRGKTLRHPIYVSDAICGFEKAVVAEAAIGAIYFIAGEEPVTISDLVNTIALVQGVRPPSVHLPLILGQSVGLVAELAFPAFGRQPPVSRRTMDFFTKHNAYDITKARRELGFQPNVDLQAGLETTWACISNRSQQM